MQPPKQKTNQAWQSCSSNVLEQYLLPSITLVVIGVVLGSILYQILLQVLHATRFLSPSLADQNNKQMQQSDYIIITMRRTHGDENWAVTSSSSWLSTHNNCNYTWKPIWHHMPSAKSAPSQVSTRFQTQIVTPGWSRMIYAWEEAIEQPNSASVYTTKNANLNTNYCFMRRHICQTSEHEEYHRKREVRRDQVSAHCFFGHGRWLLSIARLTPHPLLLHLCHYSWHSSSLPQPKSAETLTETISCHSELNKKSYTCYTVCKYDQNHKLYVTKSRAFWKKNGLLQSSNVQIWTDYCRLVSCLTDYPNATDCYDYLNSASTVC